MKMLTVNRNTIVSIFAVILLMFGWQGVGYGQNASPVAEFSDRSLAIVVRRTLKLDTGDGVDILKIPKAELLKLKTLLAGKSSTTNKLGLPVITDLTGLEHATQLVTLYLRGQDVTDLTPLTGLTQLTDIDLWGNRVLDIEPLTELTQLRELDLGGGYRSNEVVDIAPLAKLTQLRWLSLANNQINDIMPLAKLTQLTELRLNGNHINDLAPLAQLTQLRKLYLDNNEITNIEPLSQLTRLTVLFLLVNQINDITPLSQLKQLTTLYLQYNDIRDITPLAELESLTELDINSNQIRDLSPLAQLQLAELDLQSNQISDVTPLAGLSESLTELYLNNNRIRDVAPLANLIYLKKLSLGNNPVTDTSPLGVLLDKNPDVDIDIEVVREAEVPTVTEASTTDTTVSLSPASVASPAIGQQLEFSLSIAEGETVAGYQATVQFDTTALRYVSSANGDYLPVGAFFVQPVVAGDLVKLNAASLAEESDGDGTLATLTFEVVAVKASAVRLSDVLLSNKAGESAIPKVENAQITESTGLQGDVNSDGIVNIQDLVLVASSLGTAGQNTTDVNADGLVNIQDLVLVAGALGTSAAAPSLNAHVLSTLPAADVQQWLSQAQQLRLTDVTSLRGIQFLEQLLVALTPKKTSLLANYPNPFNPETWIPYHLSKDADVTLTIYAIDGQVVRRLVLGHQAAGIYQSRSRAAYWDGKNAFGEPVASGLYFYTLTADDFSATRKMLIRK